MSNSDRRLIYFVVLGLFFLAASWSFMIYGIGFPLPENALALLLFFGTGITTVVWIIAAGFASIRLREIDRTVINTPPRLVWKLVTFIIVILLSPFNACVWLFTRRSKTQPALSPDEIKARTVGGYIFGGCILGLVAIFISLTPSQHRMYAKQAQAKALATKASHKMGECTTIGDRPFSVHGKVLVYDLETLRPDYSNFTVRWDWNWPNDVTIDMFDTSGSKEQYDGPVTVFLVSAHKQQVGTYSVSHEAAYRQWGDIYVVQFQNQTDTGTALAAHQISGTNPEEKRPVESYPGYGDIGTPLARWISSMPKMRQ